METIQLENCSIPVLGFGTYQLTGSDCKNAVKNALETGYRHVDTAQIYDNEKEVGSALQDASVARNDIFLTTKVWIDNFTEDRFLRSVDESLEKLQCEYVDLLLIHWPHQTLPLQAYIPLLAEMKKMNKTKHIGVSNFTIAQLEEAQLICPEPIVTNQVEYHAHLDQTKLLSAIRGSNMFLTAYCPLGQGNLVDNESLAEIGKEYNKSTAQVALRWLVQQAGVVAIPKTASADRARENFAIFDFELSDAEMRSIAAMGSEEGRVVNPEFAPDWD